MTASLLVLAPLRIEHAVLGEPHGSRVLRTGMGPDCARIAAARALAHDASALAVAGLCAGIAPELRAGDVICATELLDEEGKRIPVPGSALLVAALRRRGLRVHVGPLVSTERILGPAERRRLEGDALAVDMESAWLADGAAGRPLAVVRVVADAAGRRLADPRMVLAGARALRSLRRTSGAIGEWARSARARSCSPGHARSAPASSARSISSSWRSPSAESPVYVRKQIVHNEHVVADLERRGAVFVEELDEVPRGRDGRLLRARRLTRSSPQRRLPRARRDRRDLPARQQGARGGAQLRARGADDLPDRPRGHEEVDGTMGEAPDAIRLVEDIRAAERIEVPEPDRVSYLTQTTLAVDETDEIVEVLRSASRRCAGRPRTTSVTRRRTASRPSAPSRGTLRSCSSPARRARRTRSGSSRSPSARARAPTSSTTRPRSTSPGCTACRPSRSPPARRRPERIVTRLVGALAALGPVEVEERTTTTESLQFRLPKEVARI